MMLQMFDAFPDCGKYPDREIEITLMFNTDGNVSYKTEKFTDQYKAEIWLDKEFTWDEDFENKSIVKVESIPVPNVERSSELQGVKFDLPDMAESEAMKIVKDAVNKKALKDALEREESLKSGQTEFVDEVSGYTIRYVIDKEFFNTKLGVPYEKETRRTKEDETEEEDC